MELDPEFQDFDDELERVLNDIQLAWMNLVQADAALRMSHYLSEHERLKGEAQSALENVQSIISEALEIVEEL